MKLLIANRGEIALRIIRTCKKLGIRTVIAYADPDSDSLPLFFADERYAIGGRTPEESYLNIAKIIKAALDTGCEAIHPGYGFLAEDAKFVEACDEHGLIFVGPSSNALEKLGNKLSARKTMSEAGVPLIPGSDGPVEDAEEAVEISDEIGYPIILKAVYGGGGRGMRLANNPEEVRRHFRVTKLESKSAFGREEIYVEKRLTAPRHIEIQALSDHHGKIVTLGERECSIQRRHQKLLEEAPSTAVDPELRKRLSEAAMKGLAAAGYTNAGTVEFLVDQSDHYYFLEVNKRLQVEHLVTEMTTGVDLVEAQLAIASGSPLEISQNEVTVNGWAVNCRINAEDPRRDFSPCPGTVMRFHPPAGPGVRVDSALYSGYTVPEYYDSLIAKLATWGQTRRESIGRMMVALDEMQIVGISTTIPLHKTVMRDGRFNNGDFDTTYLANVLPQMNAEIDRLERFVAVAASVQSCLPRSVAAQISAKPSGWRTYSRTHAFAQYRKENW